MQRSLVVVACLLLFLAVSCVAGGSSLSGKVSVITGATRGIGEAVARRLAAAGSKVVIAGRSVADGERVVADIKAAGGEALFVKTDVSSLADNQAMFEAASKAFGGVDNVMLNAGVLSPFTTWENVDDSRLQLTSDVNLAGVARGIKAALPFLRARGGGNIVLTSSFNALIRRGKWNGLSFVAAGAMYGATKAGINALTRSLYSLKDENINAWGLNCAVYDTAMTWEAADSLGVQNKHHSGGFNPVFAGAGFHPSTLGPIVEAMFDGTTEWETGRNIVTEGSYTYSAQLHYNHIEELTSDDDARVEFIAGLRDAKGKPVNLTAEDVAAIVAKTVAADPGAQRRAAADIPDYGKDEL